MTTAATPPGMTDAEKEEAFTQLTRSIHWLHEEWVVFSELFGHDDERIALLNRHTGRLFSLIRSDLVDAILLGIAKAFDDDTRTFSLRRAIAHLQDPPAGSTKEERTKIIEGKKDLLDRCNALRAFCDPIITHRHQRIAHADGDVALGKSLLKNISIADLQYAINGIANLCDEISLARTAGTTGVGFFGAKMDMAPSVKMLLNVLNAGIQILDEKWTERNRILDQIGRGEVVDGYEEKLKEIMKLYRWS